MLVVLRSIFVGCCALAILKKHLPDAKHVDDRQFLPSSLVICTYLLGTIMLSHVSDCIYACTFIFMEFNVY